MNELPGKSKSPAIGLILLQAEWFDSVVALPEMAEGVARDARNIIEYLSPHVEIRHHWQVNSTASLDTCVHELRQSEIDAVVLCFQVWAEDFFLNPLVEALGNRSLAVWCYIPSTSPPKPASFNDVLRFSGPVGTFEGMGTLNNLGVPYHFTYGATNSDRAALELAEFARAGRVRRLLRKSRFGLLPARNEQMQSTFVDEFRLKADIGPSVAYLSIDQLHNSMNEISETDVLQFIDELQNVYHIEENVQPESLHRAARASLGLLHLCHAMNLDVLSMNDIAQEMHDILGLRLTLYPPKLDESGILWGLEGDLGAATAMFILERLSSSPCLFVEFWYWNEQENWIVGGHGGVQNPAIACNKGVSISFDYEYAQSDTFQGAHLQFTARPGRVTLLQIRCKPDGWQAIAAGGEAIAGGPFLQGYPHAAVRFDVPVGEFLRQAAAVGTTQHFIMVYGDVLPEIEILCRMLSIPLLKIE